MGKDVKLEFDVSAATLDEAFQQAVHIAAGFLGIAEEDVDTGRLRLKATPGEVFRSGTGERDRILEWTVKVKYRH